jgi:hypothetical protein
MKAKWLACFLSFCFGVAVTLIVVIAIDLRIQRLRAVYRNGKLVEYRLIELFEAKRSPDETVPFRYDTPYFLKQDERGQWSFSIER